MGLAPCAHNKTTNATLYTDYSWLLLECPLLLPCIALVLLSSESPSPTSFGWTPSPAPFPPGWVPARPGSVPETAGKCSGNWTRDYSGRRSLNRTGYWSCRPLTDI